MLCSLRISLMGATQPANLTTITLPSNILKFHNAHEGERILEAPKTSGIDLCIFPSIYAIISFRYAHTSTHERQISSIITSIPLSSQVVFTPCPCALDVLYQRQTTYAGPRSQPPRSCVHYSLGPAPRFKFFHSADNLTHLVCSTSLSLSHWIISLKLILNLHIQISLLHRIRPVIQSSLNLLSLLHRQYFLQVEHCLFPVCVLCVWTGREADGFVARGKVDIEPGNKSVNEIIAADVECEGIVEG